MAEFMAIEVAEYIERGQQFVLRSHASVRETPLCILDFLGRTYYASVLGLALIGKYRDPHAALKGWQQVSNTSPAGKFVAAAGLLGISVALARLIELNHRNGVPASEIAGSLRIGNLCLSFRNKPERPTRVVDSTADSDFSTGVYLDRARA